MNKTKIRATEQPIAVDIEGLSAMLSWSCYCKKDWRAGRSKNCDRSQGSLFHRKSQEILVIFGRIERFSIYVLWRV